MKNPETCINVNIQSMPRNKKAAGFHIQDRTEQEQEKNDHGNENQTITSATNEQNQESKWRLRRPYLSRYGKTKTKDTDRPDARRPIVALQQFWRIP